MRFISKIMLLLLVSFLPMSGTSYAAVFQKVPGTSIFLSAPDGFTLTNEFSGFIDKTTGASILIATLPPASSDMRELFANKDKTTAEMQKQGYTITTQSEAKTSDGLELTIYGGKQSSDDIVYDKWSTMLFAPTAAYVVTIQVPESAKFDPEKALNVFKTLKLSDPTTSTEQLDVLPFSFEAIAPFKPMGTALNSSVMLTVSDYSNEKTDQPSIVISKGFENVKDTKPEAILVLYLASLKGTIDKIQNSKIIPATFAGQTAVRMSANAQMNGKPVDIIIYAAKADDDKPIYFHAVGLKGKLQPYITTIDKIAASVVLRNFNAP